MPQDHLTTWSGLGVTCMPLVMTMHARPIATLFPEHFYAGKKPMRLVQAAFSQLFCNEAARHQASAAGSIAHLHVSAAGAPEGAGRQGVKHGQCSFWCPHARLIRHGCCLHPLGSASAGRSATSCRTGRALILPLGRQHLGRSAVLHLANVLATSSRGLITTLGRQHPHPIFQDSIFDLVVSLPDPAAGELLVLWDLTGFQVFRPVTCVSMLLYTASSRDSAPHCGECNSFILQKAERPPLPPAGCFLPASKTSGGGHQPGLCHPGLTSACCGETLPALDSCQ